MARSTTRLLILALIAMMVLGLLTASTVRAQDDEEDEIPRGDTAEHNGEVPEDPKVDMAGGDDDDEPDNLPDEEEEGEEGVSGLTVKTIFLGEAANEKFPAGEWVETLVAFDNADDTNNYVVRFAAAHISAVGDANAYIQNFTGNQYDRAVNSKETSTFKYRFRPHESLDPRDYTLVIRVFFQTADNQTLVIAAFNNTISISDPLGADPQTYMTFFTIFAIIGGVVYYFKNIRKGRPSRVASPKSSAVEMGTGASFNKDYVGADHIRYSEELKKSSSKSPKRTASPKK